MNLGDFIASIKRLQAPLRWWVSEDGAQWIRMPDAPSVPFLLALWSDGTPYIKVEGTN